MVDVTNFLNFREIFVNELIGSPELTVVVGLVVIFFVAAKAKLEYELFALFGLLWMVIMYEVTSIELIWVSVVLGVSTIFYYMVNKAMQRV